MSALVSRDVFSITALRYFALVILYEASINGTEAAAAANLRHRESFLPRCRPLDDLSYKRGQTTAAAAMDIAYDHIQEEALAPDGHDAKGKDQTEQPSLNSELAQAYKALSSSVWGAKIGAFVGTVKKQVGRGQRVSIWRPAFQSEMLTLATLGGVGLRWRTPRVLGRKFSRIQGTFRAGQPHSVTFVKPVRSERRLSGSAEATRSARGGGRGSRCDQQRPR